jgi:hypothetical protein
MSRPAVFALMAVVAGLALTFADGNPTFAIAYLLGSGLSLFGHYWLQKP